MDLRSMLLSSFLICSLAFFTSSAFTTPNPNPGPKAQWYVQADDSATKCILSTFNATFLITYDAIDSKNNQSFKTTVKLEMPYSGVSVNTSRSYCNAYTVGPDQAITLTWLNGTYRYNLTLHFEPSTMDPQVTILSQIMLEYDLNDTIIFPHANVSLGNLRTAAVNGSVARISHMKFLKCNTGVPAGLVETKEKYPVSLLMTEVKLEAYRMSSTETFDDLPEECPGDNVTTSTMGPPTTPLPINVANYTVFGSDGKICLEAHIDMSFDVTYLQTDGKTNTTKIQSINNGTVMTGDHQYNSYCGTNESQLWIAGFLPGWHLVLHFTHSPNSMLNNSASNFWIDKVILAMVLNNTDLFPKANQTDTTILTTNNTDYWNAHLTKSYLCTTETKWALNTTGNTDAVHDVNIRLDHVQVQAFMIDGTMGASEECSADNGGGGDTSEIVPIAVGCALAALVIIVLIAYVIGRRRNRARGYESM